MFFVIKMYVIFKWMLMYSRSTLQIPAIVFIMKLLQGHLGILLDQPSLGWFLF